LSFTTVLAGRCESCSGAAHRRSKRRHRHGDTVKRAAMRIARSHNLNYRREEGDAMKIENFREVKMRFSQYVKELPRSGSVLITKNGRPCAALVPVTEDTDLEALALSRNKRFWKLIDEAIARGKKEGLVDLADV